MADLTLLIGGARSGKSTLAVEIGRRFGGDVVFLATAEAFDDDLTARIERHRVERPAWTTVEEPTDVAGALTSMPADALVLLDCLTVWIGNLVHANLSDDAIEEHSRRAVAAVSARQGPTVVITNEVGFGLHPESALGRRYRDLLGRINQQWAAAAATTLLVVAGRAVRLNDPWEELA